LVALGASLVFVGLSGAQRVTYDFILSGGHIVDGTGAPWVAGDVGIAGDRIVGIGDLSKAAAAKRVDAKGLVIAPGFIDVQGQSEFNVLIDNRAASKITQGVTTEITGEGTSIAPINERLKKQPDFYANAETAGKYGVTVDWTTLDGYFQHFARTKSAINLGTFVGAGGVRNYVMGSVNRPASAADLEQMRGLVRQAMKDGAFGVSTALEYVPDTFASTDEIVELAKVAREYNGVYFTHQRSETDAIFESLEEVFAISQRANISTTIWHLKTAYKDGRSDSTDSRGARAGHRCGGEHVSVHAGEQWADFVVSAVGFGRWNGSNDRATEGSGAAGADQERDG